MKESGASLGKTRKGPSWAAARGNPLCVPPFQRTGGKIRVPRLPFPGFRPAARWVYPPWSPSGSLGTRQFLSPFRPALSSSLP